MKHTLLLFLAILCSCSTPSNRIVVISGTVLGIEIGENPATQMYNVRLGYVRSEVALVPSTNNEAPDVLMEAHYGRLFTRDASLKQRLAVGKNAVNQPGAFILFAKNPDGTIDSNAVAIAKSLASIPSPNPTVSAQVLPLAKAYQASSTKADFDVVAVGLGFANFSDFLIRPNLTLEQVKAIAETLKAKGLVP